MSEAPQTSEPAGRSAGAWIAAGALLLGFAHRPAWPLAEAVVAILFALTLVIALRRRCWPPGTHSLALLAALAIGLALRRDSSPHALVEIGQLLGVLVIAVAALRGVPAAGRALLGFALCVGWLANLAVALGQYAHSESPAAIAGLLGNRALFGTVLAAAAPLVVVLADRARPRAGPWLAAALVVAAGLVVLYLPAFVLLMAGTILTAFLCLAGRSRAPLLAAAAVVLCLVGADRGPRPNSRWLRESLATRAQGQTRRWVLETQAGWAAFLDAPLTGHGPGRFQSAVSSGTYRAFLPSTHEKTVEPGTQCGYLVLAVEYGLVPPLCLLLLLLASARRCARPAHDPDRAWSRALAVSLVLLALGQAGTHLLVQGSGIILAAAVAVGLSPDAGRTPSRTGLEMRLEQGWLQAALLVAGCICALAVGMAAHSSATTSPATPQAAPPQGALIVLEAEQGTITGTVLACIADAQASAQAACLVQDAAGDALEGNALSLPLHVETNGTYHLWLRAWWRDGCGNSVAATIGEADPALVGNDGTYRAWHWVRGPAFSLAAGDQVLRILPRECGARVDQILLAEDADFFPSGMLTRDGRSLPVKAISAHEAQAAWAPSLEAPQPRFTIGIGGAYCVGIEAFLVKLGLPYERLLQPELTDPARLAAYPVLWIAGPQRDIPQFWQALTQYVREGGTAVFEIPERRDICPEFRELLAPFGGFQYVAQTYGLTVQGAGSPLFRDVPDGTRVKDTVCYWPLIGAPTAAIECHGRVFRFGRDLGPALMKKRLGKGMLWILPLPLGFISLRDQKDFDPVTTRVLFAAVDGRYQPLYDKLAWNEADADEAAFADDFMRRAGEGSAWQRESGKFFLTGGRPQDPLAFSLRATDNALAVTGSPNARAYRVSASVLVPEGTAGIWLTTTRARRLCLLLDSRANRLQLLAREDSSETLLQEAPISPRSGWQRLSLFQRDGSWQGWLNGCPQLSIPSDGEDAAGRFGVLCPAGSCHFDDVRVCSVRALLAGRDVRMGEEGSPRAQAPFASGLEPRSVYAPLWFLRPDPEGRHAIRIPLPTYATASFSCDGESLGLVAPDRQGALVGLPPGRFPTHSLEFVCPLWRDYTFSGRTTDWVSTGTPWQQQPRWACDPQWSFLGVQTAEPSVLWYRQLLTPPYALYVLAAPAAAGDNPNARERPRDVNLFLAGNGKDTQAGISIRVGASGREGCSLWQGAEMVARTAEIGLPAGGNALHHRWFELLAVVEGRRVRFYLEGRLALDQSLANDLAPGHVGVWTVNNSIRLARATLSLSAND